MSVELLVRQAKAGDHKARRLLAEQLRVRVERMAHYYASRSGEEYEDLLQEAWLTLFQALQDVNFSIGSPSCYLLKRAKWRMLDVIKSNRRRQHASLADFEETYPSTQNAASDGLAGAECVQLQSHLTEVQRKILLDLMEGCTWREVGARRGFSSANVDYHLKRIRETYTRVVGEL